MDISRPTTSFALVVASAAILISLVGCSSTGASPLSVASIAPAHDAGSGSSPAGSTSQRPTPATSRPVIRLDDSPQQILALDNAYSECLLNHGASHASTGITAGSGLSNPGILVQRPIPAQALAACVNVQPLSPPELAAATNPQFHAESLNYVACLQRGGVWVQLLNASDLSWTYAPGHGVPDDESQVEQRCTVQAFGGK
jgi:hypothetical protein